MSWRERRVITGATAVNPSQRSGIFSLGGDPEDDGSIGGKTFVALWTGIEDSDGITTVTPPQTPIIAFYFEDILPYSWR